MAPPRVTAFLPLAVAACGPATQQFSVPSESMEPTILKADRVTARMERPGTFNRGDIVLVEAGRGSTYIVRVAGLPGDRIGMIDGTIILNGQAVPQRLVRTEPVPPQDRHGGSSERRRLTERLPGESGSHEVYDTGWTPGDDIPLQTVRPGHLFLLGDNRDNSNDSRFPATTDGLEQVPVERVRGVMQAIYRPQ